MNIISRKDKILELVAFASLKYWNEDLSEENIEVEKARIERIAEKYYILDKKCVLEYNEFVIDWVKKNSDDIVYTDKFEGDYIPEIRETNVNNFI